MKENGISVVISAYNCGKYLQRSIDSVLNQTVAAEEIIVVDDGSTDNTADIAESYGNKITYHRQHNQGASATRNKGIEIAKNKWIAFLDADDKWLPVRLEKGLDLIQEDNKLRWCCGNCFQIQDNKKTLYDRVGKISTLSEFNYLDGYLIGIRGHTDTMLICKELLIQAGLFSTAQKRINDDDMWLRIAYIEPTIGYCPEPLAIYYRDIPESITRKHSNTKYLDMLVERHLNILDSLSQPPHKAKLCLAKMVKVWCWQMLENKQSADVRKLINKHRQLLDGRFYTSTYIGSFMPRVYLAIQKLKAKAVSRCL